MSTAPISEWKRIPGYKLATGLAPRRIAAVVLSGKKRSEVVWALSVPAESIHLVVENGAAKPSVLATLGFALFRLAALTMWRQAAANGSRSKPLESDQPRVNVQMEIFYAVLGVAIYVAAIVFILALLGLSE